MKREVRMLHKRSDKGSFAFKLISKRITVSIKNQALSRRHPYSMRSGTVQGLQLQRNSSPNPLKKPRSLQQSYLKKKTKLASAEVRQSSKTHDQPTLDKALSSIIREHRRRKVITPANLCSISFQDSESMTSLARIETSADKTSRRSSRRSNLLSSKSRLLSRSSKWYSPRCGNHRSRRIIKSRNSLQAS